VDTFKISLNQFIKNWIKREYHICRNWYSCQTFYHDA